MSPVFKAFLAEVAFTFAGWLAYQVHQHPDDFEFYVQFGIAAGAGLLLVRAALP